MLTESKHLSKIIWGGAILLLLATIVVPRVDFSMQVDSPRADATPDPFDEQVERLEERMRSGSLGDADPHLAVRLAPMLKARSLTEAGPMAPTEIIWAVEWIEEYQPQIASQPTVPARETMRNYRNDLLVEELSRLDEDRARAALDEVRKHYRDAFDIDPAYIAEYPE